MKNSFFLLLIILMDMRTYSQTDVATARWMKQPATIDGINTEWGSLNFYDDETQLSFAIANDSNNIYLCFESADDLGQMKLMHAGMKITLSTKGKPKHEASVLFPLPQPEHTPEGDSMHNKNITADYNRSVYNKESFREHFISNHSTMQVTGFATRNGDISTKDTSICAAINWDSTSNLIYEIAIAKKEFFGAAYSSKDAMDDITLSVEINALKNAEGDGKYAGHNSGGGGMHMSGGMQGGGYSGMHGGGMHASGTHSEGYGGAGGQGMTEARKAALSTKTSFKQKFVLNNDSN